MSPETVHTWLGLRVWVCYSETDAIRCSRATVWGEYPNWDDVARFVYGRRLWRLPKMRARLIAHWTDERHPYRERFQAHRAMIEEALSSNVRADQLDQELRQRNTSLRSLTREIPPVFGSFFS